MTSFARPSLLVRIDPLTLEIRTLDIAIPNGVALGGDAVWLTIEPTP